MAGRFGKYGNAKRKAHLRNKAKTGNRLKRNKEGRRWRSPNKKRKGQQATKP